MAATRAKLMILINPVEAINHPLVKYLERASEIGDLYVRIQGSSESTLDMMKAIVFVKECDLMGSSDLKSSLKEIGPDIFYDDIQDDSREEIVKQQNIKYVVAERGYRMNRGQSDDEKIAEQQQEMQTLKSDNVQLRKLCAALQELANTTKATNQSLREQNIKLQKDVVTSVNTKLPFHSLSRIGCDHGHFSVRRIVGCSWINARKTGIASTGK